MDPLHQLLPFILNICRCQKCNGAGNTVGTVAANFPISFEKHQADIYIAPAATVDICIAYFELCPPAKLELRPPYLCCCRTGTGFSSQFITKPK